MRGLYFFRPQCLVRIAWMLMLSVACATLVLADPPALKEAVMEVAVNEQANPETLVVLRDDANGIWLEESDFARLRLKLPRVAAYAHDEHRYYPLMAISGIHINIDETQQRINMQAPADAFIAAEFSVESRGTPQITPSANGAFLNYQLSAQRITGTTLSGAFTELGIFNRAGVLTSTSVLRSQSATEVQPSTTKWIRLDTAFIHDFPSSIQRLTIGDSITDGGTWGSAVRFGGISWGKDFSLRPDLITTPLLSASGTAVVPSTVDVFVNNQKVTSQQLPPGPFIIDRLPAITGSGQISMVVTDALGREQVITQSFYSSLSLLAPGLSQYQINIGRIRNNYALQSNDYGDWVAAATYRRGISSMFTIEGHAEALQHYGQTAGLDVALGIKQYGVINVLGAASSGNGNAGSLFGGSVESRWSRLTFALSSKVASRGYRQVTNAGAGYQQFKERDLAQAGLSMNRAGSLAIAYVRDSYYDIPSQRNISVTYNTLIDHVGSLSLVVSRSMSDRNSNSYFLTFTMPFGRRRSFSLDANGGDGDAAPPNEVYATLAQNAPVGPGYGYRLSASTRGNYNADGRVQTNAGDLEAQAARQQGINGQSLYWSGAATLLGGDLRATRTVYDSFALIDVDDLADIPVYVDHQLVTHTDKHGHALLHNLLPYQANRINIEPSELPLDTQINTRTLVVVPGYRDGVIVKFPVEHVEGATFRLIMEDNKPVPLDAKVQFHGKVFPVAYDGVTYVTGYDHGMAGRVSWDGGTCEFRVPPPVGNDPLPDLGTIKCRSDTASLRSLQ